MEVVASLSQGRTAAAQCGFFTYESVPVIFEPPCVYIYIYIYIYVCIIILFSTYSDLTLCVSFRNKFNDNFPGRWTGHPRISDVALRVLFLF